MKAKRYLVTTKFTFSSGAESQTSKEVYGEYAAEMQTKINEAWVKAHGHTVIETTVTEVK